jgi:hypothetical protein
MIALGGDTMKEERKPNKPSSTLPTLFYTYFAEKKNSTDLRDKLQNVWIVPEITGELPIHERLRYPIDVGESRNHELMRLLYEFPVHVRDDSVIDWYIENREYMI